MLCIHTSLQAKNQADVFYIMPETVKLSVSQMHFILNDNKHKPIICAKLRNLSANKNKTKKEAVIANKNTIKEIPYSDSLPSRKETITLIINTTSIVTLNKIYKVFCLKRKNVNSIS